MIRRFILTALLLALWISVSFSLAASGAGDGTVTNLLDGALSQDGVATFFDIPRGKPEIVWNQNTAYVESGYLQAKKPIEQTSYTFNIECYSKEDSLQLRLDIGRQSGKSKLAQITVDSAKNAILKYDGENLVTQDYSGTLQTGQWYQLTVQVRDTQLYFYINGRLEAQMENAQGYAGVFAIRSLGGPVFLRNLSCYGTTGIPVYNGAKTVGILEGTEPAILPGVRQYVSLQLSKGIESALTAQVHDSAGTLYEAISLDERNARYEFSFVPRGEAGLQKVFFYSGSTVVGSAQFYMQPKTTVCTGDASFDAFYQKMASMVTDRDLTVYNIDGHTFKMYMSWLRDHLHMMEAGIYLRENFCEILDFWLEHQHEDGFFYEMIIKEDTASFASFKANSDRKFYKKIADGLYLFRFEIEADIEYLVVDGVYMAWQATGDDSWMQKTLTHLDRALNWTMQNPERWSKQYDLPIRGSSIDTYDFVYGQGHDRRIHWWEKGLTKGTPMSIFHGDCTGFYQACTQLSEMYAHCGNNTKAKYWKDVALRIQKKLLDVAWNGSYYAHMVHVHPSMEELPESYLEDFAGDDTRLSYSNACALNRNVLTQQQASSIIQAFMNLRDNPPCVETETGHSDEKLFAEWVTIYPSYRNNLNSKANNYVNGCIAPFCGGELANGCFKWGYDTYGYDIITRLKTLCERDGYLRFFYHQDGSIYYYGDGSGSSGGPDAWGAAVTHNAIIEGLAGFSDAGTRLNTVTLSPSWTVTEFDTVYAGVTYGQQNCYVAYNSTLQTEQNSVLYQIVGSSRTVRLQLSVPTGHSPKEVYVNGRQVDFETTTKGEMAYAVLSYDRASITDLDTVEILYKEGRFKQTQANGRNLIILGIIGSVALIAGSIVLVVVDRLKSKKINKEEVI